jgi:Carboxypeptidase regulatory-like domain/PKD domain
LTGTVSSTGGQRIAGATVRVLDGVDAGKTATTNSNGEYRFDALTIANANFSATATNFTEDRRGTFINGTNTLNFTLAPAPPPAPTVSIIAREKIRTVGHAEWSFTAVVTNGTARFFNWDFGDGAAATNGAQEESHDYTTQGEFTVRVTTTPTGTNTPISASITINVSYE